MENRNLFATVDQFSYQRLLENNAKFEVKRGKMQRIAAVSVVVGCAVLALAGCSRNDEGRGNEFNIQGTVVDVGERSVQISIQDVIDARGKAAERYYDEGRDAIGKITRIHDNVERCDWGSGEHTVGLEFDYNGEPIELQDITEGQTVNVIGKFRENADACGKYSHYEYRPVYEEVRLITPDAIGEVIYLVSSSEYDD